MHASFSPPQCQLNVPLDLSELQLPFMQFIIPKQNKGRRLAAARRYCESWAKTGKI
jgi:hypothetical protein